MLQGEGLSLLDLIFWRLWGWKSFIKNVLSGGSLGGRLLKRLSLIITYHQSLPPSKNTVDKHSSILTVSGRLNQAMQAPLLVAYRHPPNLKNLLVCATFKPRLPFYKGNSQCKQPRCKTCRHIKAVETFKSSITGKMYKVKATTNCKTSNVVYVIECNCCRKQYMGETENALHVQMNGHQSDINHRSLEKPVAQHFNSNGHSLEDLSVFKIEKIHREAATFSKAKERHWIWTLHSLAREELNLGPYTLQKQE